MQPKDLKTAFSWEERCPLIADRVFHVPAYYEKHDAFHFPGWDDPQLFGNKNPICIEYCSGNGKWIASRAHQFPHLNWVAVEKRFDRVRKIWSKTKNESLSNLITVCGEAFTFTHHYVANQSIEKVFINFPDPWPKEKHEKHRLMKSPFIEELARVLKPGKEVTFVSDDSVYVESTTAVFKAHPLFHLKEHVSELSGYGNSWFESLWRDKGKSIHYLQFVLTDYNSSLKNV